MNRIAWAVSACLLATPVAAAPPLILTNHLGYEPLGPKHAVIQGHPGDAIESCVVEDLDQPSRRSSVVLRSAGSVARWRDWVYWTVELPDPPREGTFRVDCCCLS